MTRPAKREYFGPSSCWASKLLVALASFASMTLTNPAFGQALPAGMTMHRTQAGEADASGWMVAASTEGGFSVRLPLKFNDFTIAESNPKVPMLRAFVVGTKSQEGVKFSATRIVYRKGAESAKYFFSQFREGQGLGAKPVSVTSRKIGARSAVDIVLETASAVAYERAVLLGSDLLLMIIESPRSQEGLVQRLSATFLDSLVVTVD